MVQFDQLPSSQKNGGAIVSELIPSIAVNATQPFTFSTPATLSLNTDYGFDCWIDAPSDNYKSNDSILNYSFRTSTLVNSFPYLEGFETNDGG